MTLSRRHFIGTSGALLLLGACNPNSASVKKRKIEKVGIQSYTLREALAEDFIGTFQMIKDVGYDYVELNGRNLANHTPQELRRILDDIGLPAPATHVNYDDLANRPQFLADQANILGCKYVVLPWISENERGVDDYKRHASMLNQAAEALGESGVRLAYHNHQFELFDLGGGQTGMDILLNETDPKTVDFELDFFWAALGGIDIPALFKEYAGRFKLCHIKDLAGDGSALRTSSDYMKIVNTLMVNVGDGQLPFETYFALNDISGMEYFIAEHDSPRKPFKQSIQTSHDAIRKMRF